ncbi:MAG: hypothetical protein Q8K67_00350 [Geothrix sp.]|nr:hypothetical protein [Geothrix sp.]
MTVVLTASALMPGAASAAEVEAYGTTLARYWNQSYPDLSKNRYVPLTQFVGIDATGLGDTAWSLHLFGWGKSDLADQSSPGGKGEGDLTYGYLQYRAPKANAELKAGRFAVLGAAGQELVDGLSARADLRGGFTFAVFGGKPVIYDPEGATQAAPRDFIAGGRLAWRASRYGEIGVSFLQDGTSPDPAAQPVLEDRSRKLLGGDLRISPHASFDVSGRVIYNQKKEDPVLAASQTSRLAGQDYAMSWKITRTIQLSGNYIERNFKDYYAGTNLPALFRLIETEKYKAHSGLLSFGIGGPFQYSADYRKARREGNGDSTRAGVEIRTASEGMKLKSGLAYHRVTATDVPLTGGTVAFYSLSHSETRLWLLHDGGRYYLSLDAVGYIFDDRNNPMLNGEPKTYLGVASLGFRPTKGLMVSGDVSYGMNPLYKKEVRGLLRLDFRFGAGTKGGGK